MRSNEFAGATLGEAVRNATTAYRGSPRLKFRRSCAEVEIRIELAKRKLSDVADESDDLKRRAESLEREARRKFRDAAVEALILFAGPLGVLGRVARLIARLSKGRLDRRDVQKLIPAIAAVVAAKDALEGVEDLQEARMLARQADSLIRSAEDTRDELFDLLDELATCEPTPMS